MQNSLTTAPKMELRVLQSNLPSCIPRSNLAQNGSFVGQFPQFCHPKKYPSATKLQQLHIRAQQSSGVPRFNSSTVEATPENVNSKDDVLVFVAGATGRVGSRTVRELLKLGFRVRAGVRSAQRAESLVESVRQMKLDTEDASGVKPIEKLEIVECDLEIRDRIVPALGKASVVICCIGASEKEIFDVTGPYRIDYQASKNLVVAATFAKVDHFILLTSLGTNKFGFPAAILNLFWGVLCWKRKAEEALVASGLPYTIVRPGGMERPTDSYKETHNMTLSEEDTLFGGQVSNLQVAELMAFMAQNRDLSYCKVVEVIAETTAPLTPMKELLLKIPSKRDDLFKAETPKDAVRTESLPPQSEITETTSIPVEKTPSEDKTEEVDAATEQLDPEPSTIPIAELSATEAEETVEHRSVVPRPLSPYTAYEDLKPPSSPCPSPSSSQKKEMETPDAVSDILVTPSGASGTDDGSPMSAVVESPKMRPLSPYSAYEDWKPPSSPSPSPPNKSKEEPSETSKTVDGVAKSVNGPLLENVQQEIIFYHSPYPVYEDLKPPTSPTPSAPNLNSTPVVFTAAEAQMDTASSNDQVEPPEAEMPEVEQNITELKPRPLSPFAMYEDLKPPTSPSPSAPNLNSIPMASVGAESQMVIASSDEPVETPKVEEAGEEQNLHEPREMPLSPYTMYDDMKPPTSPTPTASVH